MNDRGLARAQRALEGQRQGRKVRTNRTAGGGRDSLGNIIARLSGLICPVDLAIVARKQSNP